MASVGACGWVVFVLLSLCGQGLRGAPLPAGGHGVVTLLCGRTCRTWLVWNTGGWVTAPLAGTRAMWAPAYNMWQTR